MVRPFDGGVLLHLLWKLVAKLSLTLKRVAEMSDEGLLEEGKQLRKVVYPKRILGTGPSSFALRLEICRKEWRRRNLRHVEQARKHSQNQNPGKESHNPRRPQLP